MTEPEPSAEATLTDDDRDEITFMTYAEFGQRFFEVAVTRERIADAVQGLTGRPIEFGPIAVGPMSLVKVRANGAVGTPTVDPRADEHIAFELILPVELKMTIEIGLERYRFDAAVRVRLALTARAAEPLKIVIDIEPPTTRAVDVHVTADGLRASVLKAVAGVEGELKRSVAKFVRRELAKPELRKARVIDVQQALQSILLGRGRPSATS